MDDAKAFALLDDSLSLCSNGSPKMSSRTNMAHDEADARTDEVS